MRFTFYLVTWGCFRENSSSRLLSPEQLLKPEKSSFCIALLVVTASLLWKIYVTSYSKALRMRINLLGPFHARKGCVHHPYAGA